MGRKNELKIFRKVSIGYLKRMYRRSVAYVQDQNLWRSAAPETYGEVRFLLHTRKSIQRFGNELKIFRFPTIEGVRIIYHKSTAFVFDRYQGRQRLALNADGNYLLRYLAPEDEAACGRELNIFKMITVDKLKALYDKNRGC